MSEAKKPIPRKRWLVYLPADQALSPVIVEGTQMEINDQQHLRCQDENEADPGTTGYFRTWSYFVPVRV